MAHAWLDTDGTPGDAGRRWKCSVASLFGKGPMDHRTSDLRRRWRILDESGSADRNTNRIGVQKHVPLSRLGWLTNVFATSEFPGMPEIFIKKGSGSVRLRCAT